MPDQQPDSSTQKPHLSTRNYILNALPQEDYERLRPELKTVNLTLGQVIYQKESSLKTSFFADALDSQFGIIFALNNKYKVFERRFYLIANLLILFISRLRVVEKFRDLLNPFKERTKQ